MKKVFNMVDIIREGLFLSWLRSRVSHAIWGTETRSFEITSGLTALGWFIVLTHEPKLFEMWPLAYGAFTEVAPQGYWACAALFLGIAQIVRALISEKDGWVWYHRIFGSAAVMWWGTVLGAFLHDRIASTAVAVYSVILIGSIWALIRTK